MKLSIHKNNIKIYIIIFIVLCVFPCNYYSFLQNTNYLNGFRILCALVLIFASQQELNKMIMITLCVFLLYYKVNNYCGLKYREPMFAVLPPISPYNNNPVFVPMDTRNKLIHEKLTYEGFFNNVTNDGLMGKYDINHEIPKHHDLRNKNSLDRLLKLEGELANNMSRGEKYYRHKRGFFNMF
jgi:hypothetical protein